jgi:hypothetical protein
MYDSRIVSGLVRGKPVFLFEHDNTHLRVSLTDLIRAGQSHYAAAYYRNVKFKLVSHYKFQAEDYFLRIVPLNSSVVKYPHDKRQNPSGL